MGTYVHQPLIRIVIVWSSIGRTNDPECMAKCLPFSVIVCLERVTCVLLFCKGAPNPNDHDNEHDSSDENNSSNDNIYIYINNGSNDEHNNNQDHNAQVKKGLTLLEKPAGRVAMSSLLRLAARATDCLVSLFTILWMEKRNPIPTTLKPWLKPKRLLVFAGESPFQGFLGGAGFCPSTVVKCKDVGVSFLGLQSYGCASIVP